MRQLFSASIVALPALLILAGCADYMNRYDTVTLAAGDANRHNLMLQRVDNLNPATENTRIEGDGQRAAAVMAAYRGTPLQAASPPDAPGNCPTDDSIAADGSRCGGRSAESRPGGN